MTRSEKRGRIRRWTLFAAALASFSFAARTVAAEIPSGEEKISVSLSWLDSYGLCPLALRTAEAESDAILKRMGVLADSESSSNGPGDSTIRFRAALLDVEPDAWGLDRSAFGAVRGRDVLPDEVFVFTGNVVRVTGHRADDCRVARKQREIGRALARISGPRARPRRGARASSRRRGSHDGSYLPGVATRALERIRPELRGSVRRRARGPREPDPRERPLSLAGQNASLAMG